MGSKTALGARTLTKAELRHYTGPYDDRNRRNYTLDLYASFNDRKTQNELDWALQAFRNKPVLIQFGEGDPMTGQGWHKRWAKEIPNHQMYLLPHVKHFTFEGAPERTVQNFRAWWSSMTAQKGHDNQNVVPEDRLGE